MFLLYFRNRHILALDVVALACTPFIALILRVEPEAVPLYIQTLVFMTALTLVVKVAVFYRFGLYNHYWRYAGTAELAQITLAVVVAMLFVILGFFGWRALGWPMDAGFPRSVPFIDALLTLVVAGGTRFSVRLAEDWQARRAHHSSRKRVLIIGADNAGALVAHEMQTSADSNLEPVGFVDDDPDKKNIQIHGVPVLGRRADLATLIETYAIREVIIALPTASGLIMREIVQVCEAAQVPYKTVPSMYELLSGQASATRLRKVEIEDLLRRDPIRSDLAPVHAMLRRQTVLVTGAGGSIGSELCRQIVRCQPAALILLGHGENSLYWLGQELRRDPANRAIEFQTVVGDIRDRSRLAAVFQRVHPDVVFHAAAHKHVPMMEENLEDAVTNNILGTRNVVELSAANGVGRFLLISTDKAVNPVNVMGVTKRVAELMVRAVAHRAGLPYVTVRFGNVLGSRGSVVPLFQQQIALGGPLTLTHPDVERYFMTIPEAVELVLHAATLGQNGEVFVLDMGAPVKILDLARDLIELSGFQVGRDIEIRYTGLRPGEKMYEELFLPEEHHERTENAHIFRARNGHAPYLATTFEQTVADLIEAARRGDLAAIERGLRQIVPEYQPSGPQPLAVAPRPLGEPPA
jgi:FlaA1/EpsC-like NDP-sugar epimerase